MAGKISELEVLADPAVSDLIEVLDVSDTTMAASGTNKRIQVGLLGLQTVGTVSLGTWSITADAAGVLLRLESGGASTITLPAAVFNIGQRVDFVCISGPATFVLGSGATWDVPPTPSAVARSIGSFVSAIKTSTTKWALTGDLA